MSWEMTLHPVISQIGRILFVLQAFSGTRGLPQGFFFCEHTSQDVGNMFQKIVIFNLSSWWGPRAPYKDFIICMFGFKPDRYTATSADAQRRRQNDHPQDGPPSQELLPHALCNYKAVQVSRSGI